MTYWRSKQCRKDSAHTAQCEYVLVAVIQLEQLAYRDTDASTYLKGGTLPAG